jgi:hypothetical protein
VSRPVLVLMGVLLLGACGKQEIAGPTPPEDPPVGPPPTPGNRPPTAQIGAPPSRIGPEGSLLPFDAVSSTDPDGDALHYFWDFGDGVTQGAEDGVVQHRYRNNGSYRVTLIATDPDGAADTASIVMTVANVDPQITRLSFPDTVVAGASFEIDIQYMDPGIDDTVSAMLWVHRPGYAEGGSLAGPGIVVASFSGVGEYRFSLRAEDNDGALSYYEADHPLVVIAPPIGGMVAAASSSRRIAWQP